MRVAMNLNLLELWVATFNLSRDSSLSPNKFLPFELPLSVLL